MKGTDIIELMRSKGYEPGTYEEASPIPLENNE